MPIRRNGEGGIRTRGTASRTLVFETSSIGHSDTSPNIYFASSYINFIEIFSSAYYNHFADYSRFFNLTKVKICEISEIVRVGCVSLV
jgi:hypothetical protein